MMAVVVCAAMSLSAETETIGDRTWSYQINGDTAEVLRVSPSPVGEVAIPSSLGGKLVTSIGDGAFFMCTGLTNVVISDGVSKIGERAFSMCMGLASVVVPDGVERIERQTFEGCVCLTNAIIPNSVTSIGYNAFYACRRLKSVTIPDSVEVIENYAFKSCIGLTSVTIPDSVEEIYGDVFDGCTNLTCATIPEEVLACGMEYVFGSACESLTNVVISEGVATIYDNAFEGCFNLVSVTIPDSVTEIRSCAFYDCGELASVAIPDGVTGVGASAFAYCAALTNITIGSSVTNIGWGAFEDCKSLVDVKLPNSVTSIGENAFRGCSGLTSIAIPDGVKMIMSYTFSGCCGLASVTIPDSVGGIKRYAFIGCTSLTSVVIPDSVGWIEGDAFYGCTNITSVTIPQCVCSSPLRETFPGYQMITNIVISEGVTILGRNLFYGCRNLTNVTIPDSVARIEDRAFYGCISLLSLAIPEGVRSIGECAFESCIGLKSVSIPNTVTNIGRDAFMGCGAITSISMPQGKCSPNGVKSLFPSAYRVIEDIDIQENVTNISGYVFRECESLKSITVAEGNANYKSVNGLLLTKDGRILVRGVNGSDVVIPEGVEGIGAYAFANCVNLTGVTIPNGVTIIGSGAFSGCSGLTSVSISSSVTSIVTRAFYACGGLASISVEDGNPNYSSKNGLLLSKDGRILIQGVNGDATIPASVASIGASAFERCSGLITVEIPDSVTNIEQSAFYYCSSLVAILVDDGNPRYSSANGLLLSKDGRELIEGVNGDVTLPHSVTSIVDYAFGGRSGLTSVTIGDGVTSIGEGAFRDCNCLTNVTIGSAVTCIGRSAFSYCSGLTGIIIPDSVTNIGSSAFWCCGALTNVVFYGDAPLMGSSVFEGVNSSFCAYVRRASTGWDVEIPGAWQGVSIAYTPLCDITLDANGGDCAIGSVRVETMFPIDELPLPTRWGYAFEGWWTEQEGGVEVTAKTIPDGDLALCARWKLLVVAAPKIAPPDGAVFYGDSCTVAIDCKMDGATIYYSSKGATPRLTDAFRYTGPFTITNTATIKAVAVLDGMKSEYVTATITKRTLALGEAASANAASAALPWTTGGDANWMPVGDATAASGFSAQSGVIGDDAESWMQTVVSGAGTFSFNWKVDCEWDDSGDVTWDRIVVSTNGVEAARMDGTTGWVSMSLEFADDASHTIRWTFVKDEYDEPNADYADCAWVCGATWTPAGGGVSDVVVDAGGGKTVTVPGAWLGANTTRLATDEAANGRKVWECYVVGLDPEVATNDFTITSFPMKADGTPDLDGLTFEPPKSAWNVPGAVPKLKGRSQLDAGEWQDVPSGGDPAMRFFRIEVELP